MKNKEESRRLTQTQTSHYILLNLNSSFSFLKSKNKKLKKSLKIANIFFSYVNYFSYLCYPFLTKRFQIV